MALPTPTRVAIYARVSTDSKGQDAGNQLVQLRTWCAHMGYPVVGEYVDQDSGTKGADERQQLANLFADAARRKFDLALVWALDRFSRKGMASTVADLTRLNAHGVSFHSLTEPFLSTDNELVRDILLAVLASLAKLERQKISERTKAGLEQARAKGERLGRAPISRAQIAKLRGALDTGKNWHQVSLSTGIKYSTVKKHARALGYEPPGRSAPRWWCAEIGMARYSDGCNGCLKPALTAVRPRVEQLAETSCSP